jgi:hypothetical protein
MIISAATLAGLLILAEQGLVVITSGNTIKPKYHWTDYETACGSTAFRVRFRNGPEEDGRVDHLLIDGRPVRGAAETLQIRAARRGIVSIEIMNCGTDPRSPVFRGSMNLSKAASRVASLRDTLFFRVSRENRGGWRLVVD